MKNCSHTPLPKITLLCQVAESLLHIRALSPLVTKLVVLLVNGATGQERLLVLPGESTELKAGLQSKHLLLTNSVIDKSI